jgi:alginate export protein
MSETKTLLGISAVLSLVGTAAHASDYSPTKPVRPSAGFINDWLRKDDPGMASWDIGAQVRLRYEIRDNFGILGSPGSVDFRETGADVDNAYFLHRIKPRVGYTHEWFNVLVEGRSSGSTGDDRNPNPESDGPIDLHQAYVFVGNHKEFPVSLKVGRQELLYGDERVIGAFNWNNLGRVFDAAKVRWQNQYFGADFFSGRVIIPDDNNFNMPNDYDWFSGIYANTKLIPKQTTELYLLSRNVSAGSPTVNGAGTPPLINGPPPRDIYTLGVRLKSNPADWKGWDYTVELMGQYGHFNDPAVPGTANDSLEHTAYAMHFTGGYTFADSPYTPRFGIEYNLGSGDSDPLDDKHETFENLFPTNHKFYGYMDFFSLQNVHNVRLSGTVKPLPRLTLYSAYCMSWLYDTSDNFYAVNGTRRGGITATGGGGYGINPNNDSYVGSEIDFVATYAVGPQIALEAGYGHFFVGDYVKQSLATAGSTDANWVYVQMNFNF